MRCVHWTVSMDSFTPIVMQESARFFLLLISVCELYPTCFSCSKSICVIMCCVYFPSFGVSLFSFHRLVLNIVLKCAYYLGICKSSLCLVVPTVSPLYCDVNCTWFGKLDDDDEMMIWRQITAYLQNVVQKRNNIALVRLWIFYRVNQMQKCLGDLRNIKT